VDVDSKCNIDFFNSIIITSEFDFINANCCIQVQTFNKSLTMCIHKTNRCEAATNSLLKSLQQRCMQFKLHSYRHQNYKATDPEIKDSKFSIRYSQAMLAG